MQATVARVPRLSPVNSNSTNGGGWPLLLTCAGAAADCRLELAWSLIATYAILNTDALLTTRAPLYQRALTASK